jgi:Holliday junction resolvasome RuvABC endonuclease subunit
MAKRKKAEIIHYKYDRGVLQQRVSSVVGVDSSIAGFAFCKWIRDRSEPKAPIRITTPADIHLFERYKIILDIVMEAIKPHTLVFMEQYAFGFAAAQSRIEVAGIGEQFRVAVHKKTGYEPIMVSPAALKKFYCGKGQLQKERVIAEVLDRFKIKFNTTDEAEAYSLAVLGANCLWESLSKLTKFQQEVVDQIRNEWFSAP